jgi:hypothetical protein
MMTSAHQCKSACLVIKLWSGLEEIRLFSAFPPKLKGPSSSPGSQAPAAAILAKTRVGYAIVKLFTPHGPTIKIGGLTSSLVWAGPYKNMSIATAALHLRVAKTIFP